MAVAMMVGNPEGSQEVCDRAREQTHRRDRARNLPALMRSIVLRAAGTRIYDSNCGPLPEKP